MKRRLGLPGRLFLAALLALSPGCAILGLESGTSPSVDFTPAFTKGTDALLKALTHSSPSSAKSALHKAADLLSDASNAETHGGRRLAALFFASEANFRAGRLEAAHDQLKALLDEDSDMSRLEQVLTGSPPLPGDAAVKSILKTLFAERVYLGRALFDHVVQREIEVALAFLGGAKRSLLGLKIQGGRGLAAEILGRATELAPYGRYTAQCLYELGNYHFVEEEYTEAQKVYDRLIREHPESYPWRPAAEYYVAVSFFRMNTVISRDTTNLERAAVRFRIFLNNNPDLKPITVGKKTFDLTANAHWHIKRIQSLLAEKKLDIAQYYLSKDRPKAARLYLTVVLKDFSGTEAAKEAKALLEEEFPKPTESP